MKQKSHSMRIIYSICWGSILLFLGYMNFHLYRSPELIRSSDSTTIDPDLLKQLRYLEGRMDEGLGTTMQEEYPEGFVFTSALYGFAWSRIAATAGSDTLLYQHAIGEARRAYRMIDSDEGRSIFSPILSPPYGIFYNGWRNYVLAGIVSARRESNYAEDSLFVGRSDSIAAAFRRAETPFLPSYPERAWPADATVAVASLALYDRHFAPRYIQDREKWIRAVGKHLAPATGLIPHAVHPITGMPRTGARGSSQSLLLCFLPLIDSTFAADQYALYRFHFFTTWFGLPAIREYRHGAGGNDDVDSGPILFGVGSSASVVGVGAMRMNGDLCRAEEAIRTIDALGFPWSDGETRRYFFGMLPIGDAFLAWGRSLPTKNEGGEKGLCGSSTGKIFPFSILSLVLVLLLAMPFYWWRRNER